MSDKLNLKKLPTRIELKKSKSIAAIADLQLQLITVQRLVVMHSLSMIIAFEGPDAAGKGGVIRRFTAYLDPRQFIVHAIGAPSDQEKSHHYLRRFWLRLPHKGQMAIFDRTWFGRTLVERVEGFATKIEWQRAFNEINEFERQLTDDNILLLKFWFHLSKEEQLARFEARQHDPYKRWKLTDEDWRNRDKWDAYQIAMQETLDKTNKPNAPWFIVPADDKNYLRVEILKIIISKFKSHFKNVIDWDAVHPPPRKKDKKNKKTSSEID